MINTFEVGLHMFVLLILNVRNMAVALCCLLNFVFFLIFCLLCLFAFVLLFEIDKMINNEFNKDK